ncbi:MAG: hypothetical protein DRJ67_09180 [Thermoprotei archaeon]|nr:MAG: hypothetical protein DRJ67_09180 [Thermoprotei archaeon]
MGDGKFVKITVSIPRALLEEMRQVCEEHGYTRSELIRVAVRRFITHLKAGREEVGAR